MKYERLTIRQLENYEDRFSKDIVYSRLQEIENKIEDKTLVELPFKVGYDTVYIIEDCKGEWSIRETIITEIHIYELGMFFCNMLGETFSDIYKTKAEAEKKLKELQGK